MKMKITTLLLTLLLCANFCHAEGYKIKTRARIDEKGAKPFTFRISCCESSGPLLNVRLRKRTLLNPRVGEEVYAYGISGHETNEQYACHIGRQDGRLVMYYVKQSYETKKIYRFIVGDATNLDEIRMLPGCWLEFYKKDYYWNLTGHVDSNHITIQYGHGINNGEKFNGQLLGPREILIEFLDAVRKKDPNATVLSGAIAHRWNEDFAYEASGRESHTLDLPGDHNKRMLETYVEPIRSALPKLNRLQLKALYEVNQEGLRFARENLEKLQGYESSKPNDNQKAALIISIQHLETIDSEIRNSL